MKFHCHFIIVLFYIFFLSWWLQVPPILTTRPARKNCSPKAPDKKVPGKLPEKEQGKINPVHVYRYLPLTIIREPNTSRWSDFNREIIFNYFIQFYYFEHVNHGIRYVLVCIYVLVNIKCDILSAHLWSIDWLIDWLIELFNRWYSWVYIVFPYILLRPWYSAIFVSFNEFSQKLWKEKNKISNLMRVLLRKSWPWIPETGYVNQIKSN